MQLQLNIPQPHENGTRLSGNERRRITDSMQRTNDRALHLLRETPEGVTAEELQQHIGGLLSSCRRTLTDLFNAGVLVKDGKRMGRYGVRVTVYKLKQ